MRAYLKYLITAAVFLVISAFLKIALVGYGFLALCFAGLAALCLVFMGLKALSKKKEKVAHRLRVALVSLIVIGVIAVGATECVIIGEEIKADGGGADYAIVLGAGVNGTVPSLMLRARLDAALEFAEESPEAVLILSGGQGSGEDISEAKCMYDWLTARGVDPARLVMEDRSTSTKENLTFSKQKLSELGASADGVCIITAGYHIKRAKLMAADLGYTDVSAKAAFTGWPVLETNYHLREAAAIWAYAVLG